MTGLDVKEPGSRYSHFPLNDGLGYDETYFAGLLSEKVTYVNGNGNGKKFPDMREMKHWTAETTQMQHLRHCVRILIVFSGRLKSLRRRDSQSHRRKNIENKNKGSHLMMTGR